MICTQRIRDLLIMRSINLHFTYLLTYYYYYYVRPHGFLRYVWKPAIWHQMLNYLHKPILCGKLLQQPPGYACDNDGDDVIIYDTQVL